MGLIKSSIWTGLATAIKMVSAFIINKVIAIHVGSSGLAVIGQFRDFISIVMSFANGGIQRGVVKYVAEYKNNELQLRKLIGTALRIHLACSLLVGLVLFLLRDFIGYRVFESYEYRLPLTVFAFTIVLFAINTLLMSILNGLGEIRRYVFASMVSSIIGLCITVTLIYSFELQGALMALAINQSVVVIGTIVFLKSTDKLTLSAFKEVLDKEMVSKLLNYSLMALTTSLTIPVTLMMVRRYLGEQLSWDQAGLWEGMWRLSSMYLLMFTTAFSVYLLPAFSELSGSKLRSEVLKALKFVLPLMVIMAVAIYLFRDNIILILFSEDFLPMNQLFGFQLAGDVLKMGGWVFGNIIVAKALTKVFITVQIAWALVFGVLTFLFVKQFGLQGVVLAYFSSYVIHFTFMNVFFRKLIWKRDYE